MPADPKAQIERINQVSAMARTSWIALLGYLAFIGVTLLGVEDADFFVPSRQTQLPLVNVAIPTASFFVFAPILAAALYVYLHIILLKLWDAIADLDRAHLDGQPVGDALVPWLVNDWALSVRGGPFLPARPLRALGNLASFLLVWAAAPLALFFFWWWSMPAHRPLLSLFLAGCFLIALAAGLTGWQTAHAWLSGNRPAADAPRSGPRSATSATRRTPPRLAAALAPPPPRRHLGARRLLAYVTLVRTAWPTRRRPAAGPGRRHRRRDGRPARRLARLGDRPHRLPRDLVQARGPRDVPSAASRRDPDADPLARADRPRPPRLVRRPRDRRRRALRRRPSPPSTRASTRDWRTERASAIADLPQLDLAAATCAASSARAPPSSGRTSATRGWRGRTSAARGWRGRTSAGRGWRGRTSAWRGWRGRTSTGRGWRGRTSAGRGWRGRTSAGARLEGADLARRGAGGGEPRRGAAGGGEPQTAPAGGGGPQRRSRLGGGGPRLGAAGGGGPRDADCRKSNWAGVSNSATPADPRLPDTGRRSTSGAAGKSRPRASTPSLHASPRTEHRDPDPSAPNSSAPPTTPAARPAPRSPSTPPTRRATRSPAVNPSIPTKIPCICVPYAFHTHPIPPKPPLTLTNPALTPPAANSAPSPPPPPVLPPRTWPSP